MNHTTSISLDGEERDLLYERLLLHLSGIEDLWLAVWDSNFARADQLSKQYIDELTIVIEDLGWGDGEKPVKLQTDPAIIRRVVTRIRTEAQQMDDEIEERTAEVKNRELLTTCNRILDHLGVDTASQNRQTPETA